MSKYLSLNMQYCICAAALTILSCMNYSDKTGGTAMDDETFKKILKEHTTFIITIPGVVGTAEGEWKGERCIVVMVAGIIPNDRKRIPTSIEGVPVIIKEVGELKARDGLSPGDSL